MKRASVVVPILIFFCISPLCIARNVIFDTNSNELLVVPKADYLISSAPSFYFLSPNNGENITIANITIFYNLSTTADSITFLLNDTEIEQPIINGTTLQLELRGVYNLTGIAHFGEETTKDSVLFNYLPPLAFTIVSDGVFGDQRSFSQLHTYEYDVYYGPLLYMDLELNVSFNEVTPSVQLLFETTSGQVSDSSTFFQWINATSINITVPISLHETLVYPHFIIKVNSSLSDEYMDIRYRFLSDDEPPYINDFIIDFNLQREALAGLVRVQCLIWDNFYIFIAQVQVQFSVDDTVVATQDDLNIIWGEYHYIDFDIDTRRFSNGAHTIYVYLKDWAGNDETYTYPITILNDVPTYIPPTESPLSLLSFLTSLFLIGTVSVLVKKKY